MQVHREQVNTWSRSPAVLQPHMVTTRLSSPILADNSATYIVGTRVVAGFNKRAPYYSWKGEGYVNGCYELDLATL